MTDVSITIPNTDDDLAKVRYTAPNASSCLCEGQYFGPGTAVHVVFVGFVSSDPTISMGAGSVASRQPSLGARFFNTITTMMSDDTKIIHTQLIFYDAEKELFYTYTAAKEGGITCWYIKSFVGSWRFIRIIVTEEEELAMRNFSAFHIGKPFSTWGAIWAPIWPRQTTMQAFFCTEIVMLAMQHAGFVTNWRRPAAVLPHELYHYLKNDFARTENRGAIETETNIGNIMHQRRTNTSRYDFSFMGNRACDTQEEFV